MNYGALAAQTWKAAADEKSAARRHEWITALVCARKTAAWREIGITQDVRDKLAAAWAVFVTIRAVDVHKARSLRQAHGYRRFLDAGRLMVQYDIAPADIADHIAADLSNAAMVEQIRNVHDATPEWVRRLHGIIKLAEKSSTDYGIPAEDRARLEVILQELRGDRKSVV